MNYLTLNKQRPIISAHRGDSEKYPENSLESMKSAVALKADIVELDVHLTKDNQLIVFHDDDLDRITDGKGLVRHKTLKEIKKLNAGYHFTNDNGKTYPFRDEKIDILTLEETFQIFPKIFFNIDLKDQDPEAAQTLAVLLKIYKKEASVIVGSFFNSQIRYFRTLMPAVATAAGPLEVKLFLLACNMSLWKVVPFHFNFLQIPMNGAEFGYNFDLITKKTISIAHRLGIAVIPWVINDEKTMMNLIAWGTDGICTERPLKFMDLLVELDGCEKKIDFLMTDMQKIKEKKLKILSKKC